jgi:serine/threonine protein kinase
VAWKRPVALATINPMPENRADSTAKPDQDQGSAAASGRNQRSARDDTDAMAAPTEPALDMTPGASSLTIKRATLMEADQAPQDDGTPPSRRVRNIESYVGFIVDGRYHIESVIAQGGMGVVYFARHRLIDKPVALKILRPELVNNREITARFLTEAQAASAIGSEHIVDITDYGELPDGATYIVMEYLDGLSLNQRIRRAGGLLPLHTVLAIAREIAEGLQRAHDASIVHRDLKPDNVLLVTKGKQEDFVKILDFGIAKVQSSQNQTTTAGRIFGTPHYMSPEQGRGDDLDHRTDIYSLGVILYEMVTGHVPFDGENPLGILTQHMYVEVKSLTSQCEPERVTPALECVVARCLMKDPQHRYSSMSELDEDLRRLQNVEVPLSWEFFKTLETVPEYLQPVLNMPRRESSPKRLPAAMLFGGGLAAALFALLKFFPLGEEVAPSAGSATALSSTPPPSAPTMTVMLAADPLDAHVFRGNQDLGQIPLLIQLAPGQVERLTLRRAGYKPYELVVDGSEDRLAIPMVRLNGPAPSTTAPPPPAATAAHVETARVVDLREAPAAVVSPTQEIGWSPNIEQVYRDDPPAPGFTANELPATTPTGPIALPPQNMDPSFAPEPPGPPASVEPAGPRPALDEDPALDLGPAPDRSSPDLSSPEAPRAPGPALPPGPPPVNP